VGGARPAWVAGEEEGDVGGRDYKAGRALDGVYRVWSGGVKEGMNAGWLPM
jgi:hypothetical protein